MNTWIQTGVKILIGLALATGMGFAITGMATGKLGAVTSSVQNIKAYAPSTTAGYNTYTLNITTDNATGIPIGAN